MKRRLFTILSALSLLLFVAVVVLWMRSHQWTVGYDGNWGLWVCSRGSVHLVYGTAASAVLAEGPFVLRVQPYEFDDMPWRGWEKADQHYAVLGFTYGRWIDHRRGTYLTLLSVPLALPALLALMLPSCAVWRLGSIRRQPTGDCCKSCGYDLRATSERCPECGEPTAEAATS